MRYDSIIEFGNKHNIKVLLLSNIYKEYIKGTYIEPCIKNIKNPYDILQNKNIIISGGSSGIGNHIKNKLLDLSCNVTDFSRSNDLDITDYDKINNYIKENVTNVDILINCAGYIEPMSIENTDLNIWNNHINTNLTSIFNLTKNLVNKFNNTGVILNVSSPSAKKVRNEWSAYCCSKAALNSFTLNCANEFEDKNIMVNAISPTKTNTPMIHRLFPEIAEDDLIEIDVITNYMINIICESYTNRVTGQIFEVMKN